MSNFGQGPLIFGLSKNNDSIVFAQSSLGSVAFIILALGFLFATINSGSYLYLIGWVVVGGLDLLFEWVIIIFLKKDAVRENHQIVESGSIWRGNKQYKVLTPPAIATNNQ